MTIQEVISNLKKYWSYLKNKNILKKEEIKEFNYIYNYNFNLLKKYLIK